MSTTTKSKITASTRSEQVERVNVLALPAATSPTTSSAYARLRMHEGNPDWLPAGLFGELGGLREAHHRHLRQVNTALAALTELDRSFRDAEEAHTEALRDAHRKGVPVPEDERPTPAERDAQRAPLVANVHAAVVVLAEFVDDAIKVVRRHEDEWMAALRDQAPDLDEKVREAQRLVAAAKAEAWRFERLGRWVKTCADDSGFGQQPAPTVEAGPPTAQWSPDRNALRRHWSELKPWNERSDEDDRALRELRDAPTPQGKPAKPSTREADDHNEVAGVLPLDDNVRWGRGRGGEAA